RRAFISKLRNRANLVITICVSPVLALLIATILRYSESGTYDFASAYHIPTFLFLGLIVAMFLGLTNSADDIIRDRAVLQRERNLDVRLSYYVIAKTLTLAVFALIQCVLFVLIGNYVLEIRAMFWIYLGIMFMTAMSGVSLGLLISSLVADPKTAANIVPLVLIPQIIMGGALIKYEDMNRNLARHRQDPAESKRLEDLKETLALLSGIEAKSVGELDRYLGLVDQILDRKRPFDRALFKGAIGPITAEQIYVNQKVSDLISNAEMEQSDYRRGNRPNVFFGAQKHYFGIRISAFAFNTAVLIVSTFGLLALLHWILRKQLEVRRS